MMYRVLIVDDEPWVAFGLSKLIDWELLGFQIAGHAHDGLTALRMIKEEKPDVVISDIRMPGLDGISLLEQIVQAGIDAEVIFVSGYSEFDYARSALRLGAFDYLIKQIEKPKLLETMLRCADKLSRKKKGEVHVQQLNDLFELFEPQYKVTAGDFLLNKGYAPDKPAFRIVSFFCEAIKETEEQVLNAFKESGVRAIPIRTGSDKLSFLINYVRADTAAAEENLAFITGCLTHLEAIGISGRGSYQTPISKLYQESDISLFSRLTLGGQHAVEYKEVETPETYERSLLQLEQAIREGRTEAIYSSLDKLREECQANPVYSDQFSRLFNQIVSLIHKYQSRDGLKHEPEYMNYAQIGRSFDSLKQLFDCFKPYFEEHSRLEIELPNTQIRSMMEQIELGFTKDISLGQWAVEFNISLGHLSHLFKRETGKTYSEYVTDKRLQYAKQLLRDPDLSIQHIVERVGYKDYFYFNKLFKKHFGVTPSKYRKM